MVIKYVMRIKPRIGPLISKDGYDTRKSEKAFPFF